MTSRNAEGVLWNQPLHDRATSRLRDMIVDGRLKPGEPISEQDLCDEFGISRTPLREALKVLATEGLIELLPRRGAIVTPIVTEQLREKFELVRLLEDYAVRRACKHATDAQLVEIQAVDEQLIESFKRQGSDFMAINDQLHRLIMNASGNQSLVDIHAPLWAHVRRSSQLVLTMGDFSRGFVMAHRRLMKAMHKRDADGAVSAMELRWKLADRVLASLATAAAPAASIRAAKLRAVE